jgi:hypothetical protein
MPSTLDGEHKSYSCTKSSADRHTVFCVLCELTQSDDASFGVRVLCGHDTRCVTIEMNNFH